MQHNYVFRKFTSLAKRLVAHPDLHFLINSATYFYVSHKNTSQCLMCFQSKKGDRRVATRSITTIIKVD